jgi:hypothetical protein
MRLIGDQCIKQDQRAIARRDGLRASANAGALDAE